MRIIYTLLLITLCSYSSNAQDSTITLSQFEIFASQPNKVLKKEMREIGNFGWNRINMFKATDIAAGASRYAVRLGNFTTGDMPDFIHPQSAYIDFSDLDAVINALQTFQTETGKTRAQSDIQLTYVTPNDIEFSAYYDRSNDTWEYRMAKLHKHLRTYVPGTTTKFNSRRFPELVQALKEAKATTW